MERLTCIAAALAAVVPLPAFADIGVPSAAAMIDAAGVIVVGPVAPTMPPSITPSQVLKGPAVAGRRLVLADPTNGQFLQFSLDRVAGIVGAAPAVVLGRLDADGNVLSLIWLNASLWPQGHRHDTFASDGLDNVLAFVRRVLGYSALAAKDPNGALTAVLRDLEEGRAEEPLAWLEVAVERDFGAAAASVRAAAAAVILAGRPLGPAAARQFAGTAQAYPVSLAAPILLGLAEGPAAERAKPALRSMLTARGAELERGADANTMRKAWRALPTEVRKSDARRLLALFDAPWPILSGPRADATLEAIVGRRPPQGNVGLAPAPRKALWLSEIAAILD
jgi:hypothetical protein